jgi:hypothetical protein
VSRPKVLHLTFLDQVLHCSCHIFDGHVRVNPVLVEQINSLHPEPFERGIGDPLDALRAAVQTLPAGTAIGIEVEPELGSDDHLPAK